MRPQMHLILVRHSLPEIQAAVRSREWRLSAEGRARCLPLAERLAHYTPARIIASTEPKAVETGEIVAARLGLPFGTSEGVEEHDRSGVGLLDPTEFERSIARLFARPRERMFGGESAEEASQRFAAAVRGVLERYPEETVAIVTHGTVMALFVARVAGVEPFPFWKRLGLPAFVVLPRPDLALQTIVEQL